MMLFSIPPGYEQVIIESDLSIYLVNPHDPKKSKIFLGYCSMTDPTQLCQSMKLLRETERFKE